MTSYSPHSRNVKIVIPARFESKRLPGKPLIDLKGIPMVVRTAQTCIDAVGKNNVYVATDDIRIYNTCKKYGINTITTPTDCLTGSDRVAACLDIFKDVDLIVNVQGDEPLVLKQNILRVIEDFFKTNITTTGYTKILDESDFNNPNIVKFAISNNNLIYASRAGIPSNKLHKYYKAYCHVPIYAYKTSDLVKYYKHSKNGKSPLESFEDIEILRFLELGIPIKASYIEEYRPAIDVESDINKVLSYLE